MKPETDKTHMTKHNLFGTFVDLERAFYFHRTFIYIDHSVKNNALYVFLYMFKDAANWHTE